MNSNLSSTASRAMVLGAEALVFALIIGFMLSPGPLFLIASPIVALFALYLIRRRPNALTLLANAFREHRNVALLGVAFLLLVTPVVMVDNVYWLFNLVIVGVFLTAALGLNIQMGSAGIPNMAAAAYFGIGAYTAGLLLTRQDVPSEFTLVAGAAMAAVFSVLLFIPLLRTSGFFLALVTVSFQIIFVIVVTNLEFTGGPLGIRNIPYFNLLGFQFGTPHNIFGLRLPTYADFFYGISLIAVVALFFFSRLYYSWVGVTLSTIREDSVVAETSGIRTTRWRLVAFTLGNVWMGLAGAYYAQLTNYISPNIFGLERTLILVSIVILGGMDNVFGVTIGTFLIILLPERLRFVGNYRFLIYGLALMLGLIWRPRGLLPFKVRDFGFSAPQKESAKSEPSVETHA